MVNVLVPLAAGFEELEAITLIDLFRRAGFNVITAGLDDQPVRASRQTVVIPDCSIDKVVEEDFDLIVLPGGLPGADNLRDNETVQRLLRQQHAKRKNVGAICAAPKALAAAGILDGKTITCYPGAVELSGNDNFTVTSAAIEIDDNILTSRGPGTAMDFALTLIEQLDSKQLRDRIEEQLVREPTS